MIPSNLAEIRQKYGNPRDRDGTLSESWAADNLVYVDFPYPMRLAWDTHVVVKRTRCHKEVSADLRKRLDKVWAYARAVVKQKHGYTHSTEFYDEQALKWLKGLGLDLYGGCFEFRVKRGQSKLSTHCWGIAVDFNPAKNAYGTKGVMPDWFVDIFTAKDPATGLYWVWGGTFAKLDPMHFQMCRNY